MSNLDTKHSMKLRVCVGLALAALLTACTTPYAEFYTATPNYDPDDPRFANPELGRPILSTGSDPESDKRTLFENGYVIIGRASLNGPRISNDEVLDHARKVRADRVVVYSEYTNTESGVTPLSLPTSETTYHSGSIMGAGGSLSYSGTSTSYGSTTTFVPYSVARYDHTATFWRKFKQGGLGVGLAELSPEQRRSIDSNKGVLVTLVRRESAAFKADILPGDIIRSVGPYEVTGLRTAISALKSQYGQETSISLIRSGRKMTLNVFIPTYK